ncbi:Mitochondrial substrate/solute carrier repeat and Mitochondrial carrier domain-containing protein [Strongyloides ratti]|uniref:Mitochondrial substrate/solute carrier repeat and Mitochondrial carrier domain-containing protein n=1 Tax=Strongyloides ratti TaxID=34506 RepID=A0A090LFT1_STRRB|nr:Mitochondrial substrate/solute carrier repeat and Mitochondrial carrier domain-containing protein [Strongyloides ratti]CEF68617.1 Mitochondrial substrate/solute carrier repeat and Mitochondrial carrier domain-containing protein [Strongyloides ratti]
MVYKDNMIHFMSGGLGSGVGLLVTYPLDLIRIRLQSQIGIKGESYHSNKLNNNIIINNVLRNNIGKIPITTASFHVPIVSNIYKQLADLHLIRNVKEIIINEGVRGLYKGLGASVVAFIPTKALYFFCYNAAKCELNKEEYFTQNTAPVHMFAAGFAGLSVCLTFNPIHVIKTRLQLNSGNMNRYGSFCLWSF